MKYVVNTNLTTHDNIGVNDVTMGGKGFNIGVNDEKMEEINKLVAITMEKQRLEPNVMLELILELCKIEPLSAKEIGKYLNRDYSWIKKEYISKLVKENKLNLLYPNKPKSPNQKYYTK